MFVMLISISTMKTFKLLKRFPLMNVKKIQIVMAKKFVIAPLETIGNVQSHHVIMEAVVEFWFFIITVKLVVVKMAVCSVSMIQTVVLVVAVVVLKTTPLLANDRFVSMVIARLKLLPVKIVAVFLVRKLVALIA